MFGEVASLLQLATLMKWIVRLEEWVTLSSSLFSILGSHSNTIHKVPNSFCSEEAPDAGNVHSDIGGRYTGAWMWVSSFTVYSSSCPPSPIPQGSLVASRMTYVDGHTRRVRVEPWCHWASRTIGWTAWYVFILQQHYNSKSFSKMDYTISLKSNYMYHTILQISAYYHAHDSTQFPFLFEL